MPNEIIILNADASAANQFEDLLWVPNQVYFVLLGDTPGQQQLVNEIAGLATDWRHIIWAKTPAHITPRLLSLPLRPGVLPILSPFPPDILGVSVSLNNYICRVVRTPLANEVAQAFMLAETFMQP
jgi:hypothetical protein